MKHLCIGIGTGLFLISNILSATVSTINNGDGTTTLRAQYTVSTPLVVDVRDDICRGAGWTATVTCTQQMVTASQRTGLTNVSSTSWISPAFLKSLSRVLIFLSIAWIQVSGLVTCVLSCPDVH